MGREMQAQNTQLQSMLAGSVAGGGGGGGTNMGQEIQGIQMFTQGPEVMFGGQGLFNSNIFGSKGFDDTMREVLETSGILRSLFGSKAASPLADVEMDVSGKLESMGLVAPLASIQTGLLPQVGMQQGH